MELITNSAHTQTFWTYLVFLFIEIFLTKGELKVIVRIFHVYSCPCFAVYKISHLDQREFVLNSFVWYSLELDFP